MKKPRLFLRNYLTQLSVALLLATSLLIIHSCRKDIKLGTAQTTTLTADDLDALKSIYSKGVVSGSGFTLQSVNTAHPTIIRNMNVKWDKYVINNRADNSTVVEFDMQADTGLLALKSHLDSNKVFFANKTCAVFVTLNDGTRLNFFMKVIEDFSQTKKSVIGELHYRQIPASFSGNVIFFTLDKKFINGYKYLNGKVVATLGDLQAPGTSKQVNSTKSTNKVAVYVCEIDDYYNWECTNGVCTIDDEPFDEELVYCLYDDGGGSGGVTGDTGGGGGGGSASSPSNNQDFEADINKTNLPDCFRTVLNTLEANNNSCIADYITAFSGNTPGFNWVVRGGGSNSDANAYTFGKIIDGAYTMTTTFYEGNYVNGTDLRIAGTIIHEGIHAYLTAYFVNNQSEAKVTYSQMYDDFISQTRPDLNDLEHNEMVRDFVGQIATQLMQFGQSKGYNIDYQYYSDLAWSGLTGTKAFAALSDNDKNRINDTLNTEQNGTDRFGNSTTAKGTVSGCR